MHVRPFFWLLLIATCVGVIAFAFTLKTNIAASMQVHLEQSHPVAHAATKLLVHLTDAEGIPIDQASGVLSEDMTNMHMRAQQQLFAATGQGNYETRFRPSMAGPWVVTILIHAEGFAPIRQQLFIQVQSEEPSISSPTLSIPGFSNEWHMLVPAPDNL